MSPLLDRDPWEGRGSRGTKGTQGDPRRGKGRPRGPKGTQGEGTQGYPRGPWGPKGAFGALGREWAHGAIWGYSEAISNGRQFRMEGYYECKDVPKRKLIFAEVTTNCCEVWFQEASRRHSNPIQKTSFLLLKRRRLGNILTI